MDQLDRTTDQALQARVQALHAADDESGDGRVDAADMKLQLDRIEAQLQLQDQQNRTLLRRQRFRLVLTLALALILCATAAFLWVQVNAAYENILRTSDQVNALAGRVQQSLEQLDDEQLGAVMEELPGVAEKLSALDVDALNDVLTRLPALMDAVSDLQQQVEGIKGWFGGLGGLFGGGD